MTDQLVLVEHFYLPEVTVKWVCSENRDYLHKLQDSSACLIEFGPKSENSDFRLVTMKGTKENINIARTSILALNIGIQIRQQSNPSSSNNAVVSGMMLDYNDTNVVGRAPVFEKKNVDFATKIVADFIKSEDSASGSANEDLEYVDVATSSSEHVIYRDSVSEIEEVTAGHVQEVLEHAFPNGLEVWKIAEVLRCSEEEALKYLTELEGSGTIRRVDNEWIRVDTTRVNASVESLKISCPASSSSDQPTVAIISCLFVEKQALDALIEESSTVHKYKSGGDSNVYTIGRIGKHRVVATKLALIGDPKEAITSAGSITTRLLGNFQNIEHVFIVGVGGAVPHFTDASLHARLGTLGIDFAGNHQTQEVADLEHPDDLAPTDVVTALQTVENFIRSENEKNQNDEMEKLDEIREKLKYEYSMELKKFRIALTEQHKEDLEKERAMMIAHYDEKFMEESAKLSENFKKKLIRSRRTPWCNCGKEANLLCCKGAYYCNADCQLNQWKTHRKQCIRRKTNRTGEADEAQSTSAADGI